MFYDAMREVSISKSELARKLGVDEKEVRRMLDAGMLPNSLALPRRLKHWCGICILHWLDVCTIFILLWCSAMCLKETFTPACTIMRIREVYFLLEKNKLNICRYV